MPSSVKTSSSKNSHRSDEHVAATVGWEGVQRRIEWICSVSRWMSHDRSTAGWLGADCVVDGLFVWEEFVEVIEEFRGKHHDGAPDVHWQPADGT